MFFYGVKGNRLLLGLCAFSFMMSALYLFFEMKIFLTAIAYASVSIYLGLVAWNKIAKNWILLLGSLVFVAVAIAMETGFSVPYFGVIAVNFICISLIHYFFTK